MSEPPQKRFRYASYNEQINSISVDVGRKRGLGWEKEGYDEDIDQSNTPFTAELSRLSLLDLTTPYQDLQRTLLPLTTTLPITLHSLPFINETFSAFYSALQEGQDHQHSGLDSALQLHQSLFETCLGEALPYVAETTQQLLRVGALRALEPKLVERTYSALSLILRTLASALLKSDVAAEQALNETWGHVRPYLRPKENKRYVRKCVADAWVGVIRKARSDGLARLIDILLGGDQEGMEAIWSHSLKGTASQLHSRALPIFTILLDRLIASPTPERTHALSLVSTALVHYTSSSNIKPVIETVIARIDGATSSSQATSSKSPSTIASLPSSTAALTVLSTFLFTRKGKRFPNILLKPVMSKLAVLLPHLSSDASLNAEWRSEEEKYEREDWRKALVTCIIGTLQAGELSDWLSPGVNLIESLWSKLDDRESFAFVNALTSLKWPGIEQFLLSYVARASLPSLSRDPLPTLVLLNNLASAGYLSGGLSNVQGGRWRKTLVAGLVELLQSIRQSELRDTNDRRILGQLLKLLPSLPSDAENFIPHITSLLQFVLDTTANQDTQAAREEWSNGGSWNNSHVLGALLNAAEELLHGAPSGSDEQLKEALVDSGRLVEIVRNRSWNVEVLQGAARLAERWSLEFTSINDTSLLELLHQNLLSADSALRLSSLKVLSVLQRNAKTVKRMDSDDVQVSASDLWTLCIAVESSEMTLKNVRERTTSIARLARTVSALPITSVEDGTIPLRGVITYLVAQLKVNFRPVYAETVSALANIAGSQGELVWEIIWTELLKTNEASAVAMPDLGVVNPAWTRIQRGQAEVHGDHEEDEAEFRCPNLAKSQKAITQAWNQANNEDKLDEGEVASQISHDRLDVINYEGQLLATLTAIPSVAEKHSRAIIPVFLGVAQQDIEAGEEVRSSHLSTKQRQQRTASYLELMAKFVNPKAAYRSDELHQLYLDLLSKGEPKLQGLALKCLMTYKSTKLLPYAEPLENLLEDSKFRDELARFRLGVDSQDYALSTTDKSAPSSTRVVVIDPSHRDEALPVIIRLLYGIITSRRGRSSSAQGQTARKQAVLNALSGCSSQELGTLMDLMLEPFGDTAEDINVAGRQQMGFLTLLTDVIRYLGPQVLPHWPRLVDTTIALIANAQRRLTQANAIVEDANEEDITEAEAEELVEADKGLAPLRNIRSIGLKRLVQFFRSSVQFDFTPYLPTIFVSIISPRLDKLEVENTQAPSGTLELIATLAAKPETARSLVQLDERTLPKAFACMTAVKVKPAVILKVFEILDSLLVEEEDDSIIKQVLLPHIRILLHNIILLVASLKGTTNDDLTRRLLAILSNVSIVVTDGQQAQQLASLLAPMLRQRSTTEKAKTNILTTLQRLYAISPDFADPASTFFTHNYELISQLFQTLFFPSSRRALVTALETFGQTDPTLQKSIAIVANLNAYSARRMDEPDFDRRLTAYAAIVDGADETLPSTTRAWLPILRTALFFLHEPEELSIRTNASSVLQRFVSLVGESQDGPFAEAFEHIMMPGVRRTLRSKQELVRNEALHVLSHAVKTCSGIPEVFEMQPLLAEGDDEASFFANITHIQVHRRARALRRLRDFALEGGIRESTLSTIFLPVLDHIIGGATEVSDHHMINEAITTIGALAKGMRWSKYGALVMRYLRAGTGKTQQQKYYIRAVSAVIDNFHFDLDVAKEKAIEVDVDGQIKQTVIAGAGEEQEEDADEEAQDDVAETAPGFGSVEISPETIISGIVNRLLPALSRFVATKDETESNIRIPLALGVVKLAHFLPRESSDVEVLRVITTVSQILRSKEQDTRDISRDVVCKIAVFLGPDWLVRVLKELETALTRGPQKHTLAVATHAILVLATTQAADRFADLDSAVEDAVRISAEVIWGESGKDAATEGYKTKMREVRGATSRGFDTFQLLARLVSPSKMGAVLAPLREVMHSSQAVKPMQQVDEALRRISLGLNSNPRLGPSDILSLCFSLISGNSNYLKPKRKAVAPPKTPDAFRVQMKRDAGGEEDFYPLNAHKFVAFGLDMFVTAFRRGKFDFDDLNILSRLGPMVDAIGNTLYSPASNVLLLALKATAAISRCPVPQVEPALPVFISNIFKIIKRAGGTAESEVAQTALKTLAVILRDCKASQVTETQLRYLLEVIGPDLEETDRQSAIFTVLRAIISRRFVIPEIYDLLEKVSSIMITSQSTHVQELCRGVVMAFLLDYPQGSNRLKNQMTFFARNLEYTFESGRISIMEILSAVFSKFSDDLLAEYSDLFFVALVVVLANDDLEKCRTMAAALIRLLWKRMEEDKRERMLSVLKSWVEHREANQALASAALGVFGLLAEVNLEGQEEGSTNTVIEQLVNVVEPVIEESAAQLASAESSEQHDISLDHILPHQALSAASKAILKSSTSFSDSPIWPSIVQHLLFPHSWVRYDAARLLANFLASDPDACAALGKHILLDIARKGCLVLKGSKGDDGENVLVDGKLADQVVKVLYNIAKYWAATEKPTPASTAALDETNAADEEDQEEPTKKRPLAWLMSRMSFLARHLIVHRPSQHSIQASEPWSAPILAILRFFTGVFEGLSDGQAKGFLVHILSPVYRILDEGGDLANTEDSQIESLRSLSLQIREHIQSRVGTTSFSQTWEHLRKHVQTKRQSRRDERVQLAVRDPVKYAERRKGKLDRGKEGKKRRVKAFAEGRAKPRSLAGGSNMRRRQQH